MQRANGNITFKSTLLLLKIFIYLLLCFSTGAIDAKALTLLVGMAKLKIKFVRIYRKQIVRLLLPLC